MDSFAKSSYLQGTSEEEEGGLVKKKTTTEHEFKKPSVSLLGLDVLARKKKLEAEKLKGEQKSQNSVNRTKERDSNEVSYSGDRISFGSSGLGRSKDRHYRSSLEETPSHTGGVSSEARKKMEESRQRTHHHHGLHASSKDGDRKRRYDRRDRDGDGYHDRKKSKFGYDRGRRDDDRDHERRSQRMRSDRSVRDERNMWAETPDRKPEGEWYVGGVMMSVVHVCIYACICTVME